MFYWTIPTCGWEAVLVFTLDDRKSRIELKLVSKKKFQLLHSFFASLEYSHILVLIKTEIIILKFAKTLMEFKQKTKNCKTILFFRPQTENKKKLIWYFTLPVISFKIRNLFNFFKFLFGYDIRRHLILMKIRCKQNLQWSCFGFPSNSYFCFCFVGTIK